jgi:hypothetical protein
LALPLLLRSYNDGYGVSAHKWQKEKLWLFDAIAMERTAAELRGGTKESTANRAPPKDFGRKDPVRKQGPI